MWAFSRKKPAVRAWVDARAGDKKAAGIAPRRLIRVGLVAGIGFLAVVVQTSALAVAPNRKALQGPPARIAFVEGIHRLSLRRGLEGG